MSVIQHIWLNATGELLLWQGQISEQEANWRIFDGVMALQSFLHSSVKSTARKGQSSHAWQICLYVPSHEVLSDTKNLTAKQLSQLGQAGQQYLFEEMSLSVPSELVVRHHSESGLSHLYAVSQTQIKAWQAMLAEVGEVVKILPDFVLLPFDEVNAKSVNHTAKAHEDFDKSLNQPSNQSSSKLQDKLSEHNHQHGVASLMVNVLAQGIYPVGVVRLSRWQGVGVAQLALIDGVAHSMSIDEWRVCTTKPTGDINQDWQAQLQAYTALSIISTEQTISPKHADDAIQNTLNFVEYQAKGRQTGAYIWLVVAIAGVIITKLLFDVVAWRQYTQAAEQTKSATMQQYQRIHPNTPINPRVSLQAQLRSQETADSDLPAVIALIKASGVRTTVFDYDTQNKQLKLQANAENTTAQALVLQLRTAGYEVRHQADGEGQAGENTHTITANKQSS